MSKYNLRTYYFFEGLLALAAKASNQNKTKRFKTGWPLSWKSEKSGKSQEERKMSEMIRQKLRNLRKKEETQGRVGEF